MKWIKLEEENPPKDGLYLVVKADKETKPEPSDVRIWEWRYLGPEWNFTKELKPEPSDVRIWEWRDFRPEWNFTTFWANQEEVDDLGGWPTHWAHIEMHGL